MADSPKTAESEAGRLVLLVSDRIIAEINDPRTSSAERSGLRIAHAILRKATDEMGVKYD